jgi:uncharacterized protein (DUF58 family)
MTEKENKRGQLRRLEIKTRKLSNQVFSGSYHSAFKGRGISFSEVREYQFGDDVRSIDWNVTARSGKPFIKVFEEERELTVMLLIDVSRSSFFGTQNEYINHILAEISAVLAFSAITNQDKVGVIFFSDRIEQYIPPKKGKSHIMRIISELYDFRPQGKGTDFRKALEFLNNVLKKRAIVFMMSDFVSDSKDESERQALLRTLQLAGKKHDLIGIQVYDQRETEMPSAGLLRVQDPESGELFWADSSDVRLQADYKKWFRDQRQMIKEMFARSGTQFESMSTTDNYVSMLMQLFRKREVKR